ncbi:AhpA/YtjB family protein [Pseudoalteromonas sp. BZB3]|uniref:AhpA/YtjB family protein n=1 Tax=Pseudoalteromonas sp. BZB3 TaxID=3136670 RepID=UPI0032C46A9E
MDTMKNTQALDLITSSKNRRLIRLIIAAACFITLTWIAFNTSFRSHQLLNNQAHQAARSLAQQTAWNASYSMQSQELDKLEKLTKNLAKDPYVLGAAIYDHQGQLLTKSEGFQAEPLNQGIAKQLPGISKLKDAIVLPITNADDKPLGFVNMVYLTQDAMSESHHHFHELGRMVLLMLIITCVFTWQLGRALKRWEVKRQILKSEQDDA